MGEPAETCPKCLAEAVAFDDFSGIKACESCGHLLEESELVLEPATNNRDLGASGLFVSAEDSGREAGAALLRGSGVRVQQCSRAQTLAGLCGRLLELGSRLRLQAAVTDQALHLLAQLAPSLIGRWRRDDIVAAALYAACRMSRLPLTLRDLSGAMQTDIFSLGRHYRAGLQLLQLQPPALDAATLLEHALNIVAASLRESGPLRDGERSSPTDAAAGSSLGSAGGTGAGASGGSSSTCGRGTLRQLLPDAIEILGWMEAQCACHHNPLASAGAALVLAADAGGVQGVSCAAAATALHLCEETVERKLLQVRRRLLAISKLLPYSAHITARNVGSHARTIIKLSGVLCAAGAASQAAEESAGAGAESPGAAAAGQALQALAAPPPAAAGEQLKRKGLDDGTDGGSGRGTAPSKQPRAAAAGAGGAEQPQPGVAGGASTGAGAGEDDHDDSWDASWCAYDGELDQYLRRPEEVAVLQPVLEARLSALSAGARNA